MIMNKKELLESIDDLNHDRLYRIKSGLVYAALAGADMLAANVISGDARYLFWLPAVVTSLTSTSYFLRGHDDAGVIHAYRDQLNDTSQAEPYIVAKKAPLEIPELVRLAPQTVPELVLS